MRHAAITAYGSPIGAPFYVILSNLQSGSNIGSICRNALAFNASEVVVVGRNNHNGKMRGADRGAHTRLTFVNVATNLDAKLYLNSKHANQNDPGKPDENNIQVVGVEIHEHAVSIDTIPFQGPTAFLFGNEGAGLSQRQRAICDSFVYIPQFAPGGMASINVACASAIVFHSFARAAAYGESTRKGEKFV
jgi:tRNA G18 (ribose-2'-O)-methylase SpoU